MTIKLDNSVHLEEGVVVDPNGDIELHEGVVIRKGAILKPESGFIKIHPRSVIGPYCVIHGKGGVELGADTLLSPHVQLYAQNHTAVSAISTGIPATP